MTYTTIFAKTSLIFALTTLTFAPSINTYADACTMELGSWQQVGTATTTSSTSQAFLTDDGSTNLMLQAIRGTDNKLYSRLNNSVLLQGGSWTAWQEGSGITIKSEPELTVYSNGFTQTFLMSAFGSDNGLYTRTSTNGTTWTPWVKGGDITVKSRPTVSFVGSTLVQSAFGSDNGLYTRTSTDGTTWTPWTRGGDITLSSRVEQFTFDSKLIQFGRGTDNGLYSRHTTDNSTYTAWVRNSGGITVLDETSTTSFVYSGTVKLQQVVRGTDKGVYFRSSTNGIIYTDWARLGSKTFTDKPTINTAAVLCGSGFRMNLFGKGEDNRLYSAPNTGVAGDSFGFDSGTSWTVDSGITLGNTPAEKNFAETGFLSSLQSARGSDNKVYTRVFDAPS